MRRAAVFLDRDGTIIRDAHYVRDPADVRLLPGAAGAIARLNAAGVPTIVVTNQSGIARRLLSREDYDAVQGRVEALLAAKGGRLDAVYVCPHHPDFTGPCECRKPGTLLYRRAAADYGLDLARSTYVGDRWRDVAPALELGGRGILVATSSTPDADLRRGQAEAEVVGSLEEAVELVLAARASGLAPRAPTTP
ncbi:MAG: D-glycero-alpha-D-manno-heptose-1,7-bisphosphate 7-phosphatase [Gemmatimonadaceae bacterium]